jgi:hypothetical protein
MCAGTFRSAYRAPWGPCRAQALTEGLPESQRRDGGQELSRRFSVKPSSTRHVALRTISVPAF